MIQRIQTIYLLVALAINAFVYSLTLATFNYHELSNVFSLFGLIDRETGEMLFENWLIPALSISSILVTLLAIFLFKRRNIQIKTAQLALFFQTAFVAAIFFFVDQVSTKLAESANIDVDVNYESGSWLALFPLIFLFLAIKAIKKDEKMIRAADRLR
jgi:uncharacterized protein DUF4293